MSVSKLYHPSPVAGEKAPPEKASLSRRLLLLPAWVLPACLILAFGGIFAAAYRDQLLPALPVKATPAVLLAGIETSTKEAPNVESQPARPAAETMLFQAGGWFEPDPLPIFAIALTDGVIRQVHVLEGQEVSKGQLLAELIDEDARIALSAADRSHTKAVQEAKLQQVLVSVAEAEAAAVEDQVRVAEARLAEERDNLARLARIPAGSVSDQERSRARFLVEGQGAEVAARKSQMAAARAKVEAARSQIAVLEAAVATALVEVEKQKLALSRTRITSPVDGVILELHAAPGQKKLLAMDDHQSATIATLYEKGKLQARVDVPLANARGLRVGQRVVVVSDFLPDVEFAGVVSRVAGSANVQRNTLQAKVRILKPDARLRPEMLCRVKFMGNAEGEAEAPTTGSASGKFMTNHDASRAVMVPEEAILANANGTTMVWMISPEGTTASQRSVTLGTERREGFVAIASGLLPGELVILPPHDPLTEGRRVRPVSSAK